MTSVYVFGPIYISGIDYLETYKKINSICEKYFDKVLGTYPDFWNTNENAREFWDRTYSSITGCNLFIAECSTPSHGVGMEMQMGQEHNIPLIVVAKADIKNFEKSLMVMGLPNLKCVIRYKDFEDLYAQLNKVLKEFAEQNS